MKGKIQLFPMLRVALFFIAGLVAGDGFYGSVSVNVWYMLLISSLMVTLLAHNHCVLQSTVIFISFVFFGGCLMCHERSAVETELPGVVSDYSAVVSATPKVSGKMLVCDMIITDKNRPLKIKASIYKDKHSSGLGVGDGIRAMSLLRHPANYAGATFDYRLWLIRHGYTASTVIYPGSWHRATVDLKPLSYVERVKIAALELRKKLLMQYKAMGLEDEEYAVIAAMALGERSYLTENMKEAYSVSGVSHVLALSGMHLGIIYALLTLLLSVFRKSFYCQLAVIVAIWTYVFIAGMPVSLMRSAIMLTIYSFIGMFNRDRMSLNALAVASMAILINNPMTVYDVGFQMSFIAVFFILILYNPLYKTMSRHLPDVCILRWLCKLCSVSIAAQTGVAPLVAYYFGRFSCLFLLTNIMVVPIVTVIIYSSILMLPLSFVPFLHMPMHDFLVKTVSLLNSGIYRIASLSGADIDGINIGLFQLIMIYVVIFSVYMLLVYLRKMKF